MPRSWILRLGGFTLAAFSIQLVLGASALPCLTMDRLASGHDAQSAGAMDGMSMPDAGTGDHSRDDCNQETANATCEWGMACTAAAIPSVAIILPSSHRIAANPVSLPATLRSALTAPDRPPPRA